MTMTWWCLLVTGFMPIVCAGISKWGASDYDNGNPREWLARQEGYRRRANAAQQNSWEAFLWFAVAVLVAMQTGAEPSRIDGLAILFVASRVLYVAFYVADRATLRSLAWLAGLITTVTIFASGT
jgi:uncharacterized MAPEG superfamily protein